MTGPFASFMSPGLAMRYLDAFDLDPASGLLTVPRLIVHDEGSRVPASVVRETFQEGMAPALVEEIEEMWGHLRSEYPNLHSTGRRFGPWKAGYTVVDKKQFGLDSKTLHFQSARGRLVEWSLEEGAFVLGIGVASPVGTGEDLEARGRLFLPHHGRSGESWMEYDFNFDDRSLIGLLRFLDIEDPGEHFEWFSRDRLEEILHARLEDGLPHRDRFKSDHNAVAWRKADGAADESSGALWPDDSTSSLNIELSPGVTALLPGFLPLWEEMVRRVRRLVRPRGVSRAA